MHFHDLFLMVYIGSVKCLFISNLNLVALVLVWQQINPVAVLATAGALLSYYLACSVGALCIAHC